MLCRSAGYYSGEGCGTTTTVGFQDTQSISIVTFEKSKDALLLLSKDFYTCDFSAQLFFAFSSLFSFPWPFNMHHALLYY